nr:E2 protein [human papillomavirus 35]
MMETLSQRLSVCQDKILEHYKTESTCLSDHILYWKLIRLECAVFYKAREMGIKTLNHQVVPTQAISKAKAMQAIELQLMLETLNTTEYRTETWTLQETSIELYTQFHKDVLKNMGLQWKYNLMVINKILCIILIGHIYYIRGQYMYCCKGTGKL